MNSRVAHKRFIVVVALAVTAGAVTIAGCGDDDAEGLPRGEYISRADAICADANEKELALDPGGLGWHYGPRFSDAHFLSRFNAVGRAALRRLRGLVPLEQDRKAVDAVLSSIERSVAAMDAQVDALRAGDRDRTAANVGEYERAYGDLAASAGPVGLSECQGLSN